MLPRVTQPDLCETLLAYAQFPSRVNKYLCTYSGEVTQHQLPEENDSHLWRLGLLGRNATRVCLLWKASLTLPGSRKGPISSQLALPVTRSLWLRIPFFTPSPLGAGKGNKSKKGTDDSMVAKGTSWVAPSCDGSRTAGSAPGLSQGRVLTANQSVLRN